MDNNLLSVIVITYNQPQYIFRLLDSIFIQTYHSIELIITDDGTIDFDESSLLQYINSNKRKNIVSVKILHENINIGTVKNINRGLLAAKGAFVKIVAGDDFFPTSSVFSKQVEYLYNNPDCFVVSGQIMDCFEDETPAYTRGACMANELQSKVYKMDKEKRLKYCFKHRIFPYATQTMCFRMAFIEIYGFYDERFSLIEDISMANRLVDNDVDIGVIGECVIVHRINSGVSATRKLFRASGFRYYEDNKLLFYESYSKEKNLWWKLVYYNHYKIASYRIAMAGNDNKLSRFGQTVRYIPSLILYSLINYDIFLQKIKSFSRSFR